MGDPGGVGPEVLLMSLADPVTTGGLTARVYASKIVLERRAAALGVSMDFELIDPTRDLDVTPGGYSPETGRAAMACVEAAADDLEAGTIDALVTGPIHKRALAEAGLPGAGHTEWLARRFGVSRPVMMLAGPRLKVVLATTHLPLREVASALSVEGLVEVIEVAARELERYFHPGGVHLAVAALNPHGEEAGRAGREEREVIGPAVERLRARGVRVDGPLSADAVFAAAVGGRYDAVVALYHDQGLAPVKTLQFAETVNVTLGLGYIRTSPDHGPAYDLAGSGVADPTSMKAALTTADAMAGIARSEPAE